MRGCCHAPLQLIDCLLQLLKLSTNCLVFIGLLAHCHALQFDHKGLQTA